MTPDDNWQSRDTMSDTTIDDLNDDCLLQIFSFLTVDERLKTEEVCRRWLDISLQGWPYVKYLDLSLRNSQPDYPKTVLHRCGRFLKNLNITKIGIFNDQDLVHFQSTAEYCSQLEIFKLQCCFWCPDDYVPDTTIANDCLLQIVSKMQKLHTMELRCWSGDILDEHFSRLSAQNLKNLSTEDSAKHTIFSGNISRFSNLRTLTISFANMTDASIKNFEKLQSLIELHLKMCNVPVEFPSKIAHLKNLRVLKLHGSSTATRFYDPHISAIARGCPELEYLSLVGMHGVTDTCFINIAQLSKLRTLRLEYMSKITDRSIINMRQIHTLHLNRCFEITHRGLQELIGNSSELRLLKIVLNHIDNTLIKDVNEAILLRGSSRQFTLEVVPLRVTRIPKNLSPLLILEDRQDN